MSADFTNKSTNGRVSGFNPGKPNQSLSFSDTYKFLGFLADPRSTDVPDISGRVLGRFYGDNAQVTGGTVRVDSVAENLAVIGVFTADQQ